MQSTLQNAKKQTKNKLYPNVNKVKIDNRHKKKEILFCHYKIMI